MGARGIVLAFSTVPAGSAALGMGFAKRRGPIGGSANGMPSHCATSGKESWTKPSTEPMVVPIFSMVERMDRESSMK